NGDKRRAGKDARNREQGTGNKEQGKRQKERSDVGGRRAEVSRYEVRGTRGKRNTCPYPRCERRPPEPEQGTRNRASGRGRSQMSEGRGFEVRSTRYEG